MKKFLSAFLILTLLCASMASADVLPDLFNVFGVEMPSLNSVMKREADSIETSEDGSAIYTYCGIDENAYEAIDEYFAEKGCNLGLYDVADGVLTAEIRKGEWSITFTYDYKTSTVTVTYPMGIHPEEVMLTTFPVDITVGSEVVFGKYEQDANEENGAEDIEWIVLGKEEGNALLISKYAIECEQFNKEYIGVTWEDCTLRAWLNNDFYNKAFSADEKQSIVFSKVTAEMNPSYSTNPGNDTDDYVFLLNISEVNKYFKDDTSRMCAPTDYAVKNGAFTDSDNKVDGRASSWWWLRSPGNRSNFAAGVSRDGSVRNYGGYVGDCSDCVRPCVWVRLK